MLKARHRAGIVAAARSLIDESGVAGLTADSLADRADVARRTVFNHFASLEEVVVACVESELAAAIASVEDGMAAPGPQEPTSPLDDLEASLRTADLATAVSRISRMLAGPAREATAERVRQEAIRRTADDMVRRLAERHPDQPRLLLELLTSTVMNGVGVVAAQWAEQTSGSLDACTRRSWDQLLDLLFSTVRHGFGALSTTSTTGRA